MNLLYYSISVNLFLVGCRIIDFIWIYSLTIVIFGRTFYWINYANLFCVLIRSAALMAVDALMVIVQCWIDDQCDALNWSLLHSAVLMIADRRCGLLIVVRLRLIFSIGYCILLLFTRYIIFCSFKFYLYQNVYRNICSVTIIIQTDYIFLFRIIWCLTYTICGMNRKNMIK